MQPLAISTRAAFRTALSAGAVALTVAGASLATTAPAEAFVRHGGGHFGGFHGGDFRHGAFHRIGGFGRARFGGSRRFGYGRGHFFGGYGFRRRIVGYRTFGLGRFGYGIGTPVYRRAYRVCPVGRHLVPGLGCRLNAVYGYSTFGYRPAFYGVRRFVRPLYGYGYGFRHHGHFRHFGGRGFRHAGFREFRHGGFHHGGFGHRGGFHHGGHVRRR